MIIPELGNILDANTNLVNKEMKKTANCAKKTKGAVTMKGAVTK